MKADHEEWRQVVGYEGRYDVSNFGRIRSLLSDCPKILSPFAGRKYLRVSLCNPALPCRKMRRQVHQLVAAAFIGKCPQGYEVNHEDGDRHNNAASNLSYVTQLENRLHAVENGLVAHGERNAHAKITAADVIEIRRLATTGMSHPKIASGFPIARRTVQKIIARKIWARIT